MQSICICGAMAGVQLGYGQHAAKSDGFLAPILFLRSIEPQDQSDEDMIQCSPVHHPIQQALPVPVNILEVIYLPEDVGR